MTKLMVEVSTRTPTDLDTKVSGKRTNNTDLAPSNGLMVLATRASMLMARNTARASSCGLTSLHSLVTFTIITLRELVFMNGLTGESLTVSGKTTRCKVMA